MLLTAFSLCIDEQSCIEKVYPKKHNLSIDYIDSKIDELFAYDMNKCNDNVIKTAMSVELSFFKNSNTDQEENEEEQERRYHNEEDDDDGDSNNEERRDVYDMDEKEDEEMKRKQRR